MIGEKVFDCREMFYHACTFAECADMALAKLQHDTAQLGFYDLPSAVNSAFACEVFLKSILKWYGINPPKSHSLQQLYNATPTNIQSFVKAVASNNYGGRWTNEWKEECLKLLSNAFEQCRYLYEHDFSKQRCVQIEIGFLVVFRNALREACSQLFFGKTWEQFVVWQPHKGEQND